MLVIWVSIPKGEGIRVWKQIGRVQFLVLLRLWTGPPQNNNNNNTALLFGRRTTDMDYCPRSLDKTSFEIATIPSFRPLGFFW